MALIDWDTQMIYDRFHILILLLSMASLWLFPQHGWVDRLIGALVIAGAHVTAYAADTGPLEAGDQTDGGIRLVSRMCTGDMCHVFGILSGGTYAGVMLATKKLGGKELFCFWSLFLRQD